MKNTFNKDNLIKNKKGVTLIELLLYISLASAVLIAVSIFLNLTLISKAKTQTILEVEQQGNIAMHKILRTIRQSRDVNSPTTGNSASSISLQFLAPSKNPTIINTSNSILQVKEGSQSAVALTSERITVSNLTFSNISRPLTPDNIKVTFTVSHNNPSGRNEFNYQQTFNGTANIR